MKRIFISLSISGLSILASCSHELSPYTQSIQNQARFSQEQLQQIQFYVSEDIILQRNVSNAETQIVAGEVKLVNGREIEEIIIRSGTPGVVVGMEKNNILLVSFDKEGSTLRFGMNHGMGGRYTLMAKDWNGRTGQVDYSNRTYTTSPSGTVAHLLFSMEHMQNITVQKNEAAGRTLNP